MKIFYWSFMVPYFGDTNEKFVKFAKQMALPQTCVIAFNGMEVLPDWIGNGYFWYPSPSPGLEGMF